MNPDENPQNLDEKKPVAFDEFENEEESKLIPNENEKKEENKEANNSEKTDEYGNMPKIDIPAFEKDLGNKKYKEGLITEASKHYSKALLGMQFLIKDNIIEDENLMLKMIKEIEIPCNLNLAQCYIKLKEYKSAISHTSKVLEIEQDNVKALYRRGISYMALQEFECAKDDLKKALEKDPENTEIFNALQQMKQEKHKFNEKLKQMSQKMINSLDYSQPQTKPAKGFANSMKSFWSSLKYHCKMIYLIPLGFLCERCCKKRLPTSFYKKTQ